MPLKQQLTRANGVETAVHVISYLSIDYEANVTIANVKSYVSQDILDADSEGVNFVQPLTAVQLDGVPDGEPKAWAYDQMSQQQPSADTPNPVFTGATVDLADVPAQVKGGGAQPAQPVGP